jgi:hypothetical protein
MIINFLQTRKPAILPALHQRPHMKLPPKNGVESTFADDLKALRNFGQKNEESLGELLFGFFRFYGHEFDYDKLVVSVRSGKQISKVEKKWHITNNNTLCVEEPFNTGRNLGNTADDTSFRGLHIEMRRAFDLISVGKLEECCEEYEFPKEEKLNRERPTVAKSKPAVIRSASQSNSNSSRGRGSGHRGGRNQRSNNNNRRASSSAFDPNPGYMPSLPHNIAAQDHLLQLQAQAQLHNDLYQTYSFLQSQENSLRQQLFSQSQALMQAQGQQAFNQSQTRSRGNSTVSQQATDRNRTNSFDQPPLTAPIRPEYYYYPINALQYNPSTMYQSYSNTNPPSPSMSSAAPELRRSIHRSSITNGSGGQSNSSLRSHSQPAARSASSQLMVPGAGMGNPGLGIYSQQYGQPNGVPNFIAADENSDSGFDTPTESLSVTTPEPTAPKDYLGYYLMNGSSTAGAGPMRRASVVRAIPTFGDLQAQQGRRRLSTDHQFPPSFFNRLGSSRSPSPLGHDRSASIGAHSAPITAVPSQQGTSNNNFRSFSTQGPLVVNGSNSTGISITNWRNSVDESSPSEDHSSDAAVGSMESSSHFSLAASDLSGDQEFAGHMTPKDVRIEARVEPPMVVNGSSTPQATDCAPSFTSPPIANGASPHQLNTPNGFSHDQVSGAPRLSPNTRNRLARQAQNGGMSPLDIGLGQGEVVREDLPHLSPVYETRTPSPTANRKFEPVLDRKLKESSSNDNEGKPSSVVSSSKLGPGDINQVTQATAELKLNGHTRAVKSEGSPGSWQKISKGKKKGAPSETRSAPTGQSQSEKQPSKVSERKGG